MVNYMTLKFEKGESIARRMSEPTGRITTSYIPLITSLPDREFG